MKRRRKYRNNERSSSRKKREKKVVKVEQRFRRGVEREDGNDRPIYIERYRGALEAREAEVLAGLGLKKEDCLCREELDRAYLDMATEAWNDLQRGGMRG